MNFRNRAAIPSARMVAFQPEMVESPATVRDIKTSESANETREPALMHRYDGPVPLTARSSLVGLVFCQRLDLECRRGRMIDHLNRGDAVTS